MNDVWLRGEFYVDSDGPTILLGLTSATGACRLRALFLQMVGSGLPVDLAAQPGIQLDNLDSLALHRVEQSYGSNIRRNRDDGLAFEWVCTDDEWQTNAEMLDPFCRGCSGHQYLSAQGANDAEVEVTFGE